MRAIRRTAPLLAALLGAPFAGSTAHATACSPNLGPYPCPVQATAGLSGAVDSCEAQIGAPGYYCNLKWFESYAGGAVTPGTVTVAEYSTLVTSTCKWVTTGCSGTHTQEQGLVVTTCGTISATFWIDVTATSVTGAATETATSTLQFTSPVGPC